MNDLQQLSAMALWGACVLYAIAMVAYAIRLSRVAELKGAAAAASKGAESQATVSVGTSHTKEGAASAVADAQPTGGKAGASKPKATTASAAIGDQKATKALGIARAATLVGAVLHTVGVTARGIEAEHVPWSTMYEYTISGSLVAVVVFLLVQRKRDITYMGAGVTGLATIALGLGLTVLYQDATGLQPALQSFWLVIHVSIATIATGIFGVGFIATALQLMRDYRDSEPKVVSNRFLKVFHDPGVRVIKGKTFRFLEAVPTPKKLEALAFRLNAVGFVLWTFTVMAGAIWAEHAWGRYWGWDPKEIWSFVIWVIYAAYLHARTTQGWAGRRSAWVSIVGFAAIIMNFTVVNLVFQGLHSYAKA
ncbi:c-type cytochrome biogenesis protein CcsB [Demequina aurantiaca]|uniref:c-type cytochrome biogenesis protein CcsB n=1 Tax=Demequina aurantiaca TaxID=676200 RepID=UPI00078220A7|nr:c-type cytochrome biogenesis protein CcsB [Demequina aurantiaca]